MSGPEWDGGVLPITTRVQLERSPSDLAVVFDYDGRQPPRSVFAAFARHGWRVPAPVPPPAHAIDWTPDDETGEPYTVRDYPVLGHVIGSPVPPGVSWSHEGVDVLTQTALRLLAWHDFELEPGSTQTMRFRPLPSIGGGLPEVHVVTDSARVITLRDALDGVNLFDATVHDLASVVAGPHPRFADSKVEVAVVPERLRPTLALVTDLIGREAVLEGRLWTVNASIDLTAAIDLTDPVRNQDDRALIVAEIDRERLPLVSEALARHRTLDAAGLVDNRRDRLPAGLVAVLVEPPEAGPLAQSLSGVAGADLFASGQLRIIVAQGDTIDRMALRDMMM